MSLLTLIEDATYLFCRKFEPTINNVYVFKSGIIGHLESICAVEKPYNAFYLMCTTLKNYFLARRSRTLIYATLKRSWFT